MNRYRTIILSALLALAVAPALFAESQKMYDPAREVTISGDALYVAQHPAWVGIFAIMREGSGEVQVLLAPNSFLSAEGVELHTGDTLKVVGSKVRWNNAEVIVAREVTAKGKTLELRDKDGKPRW